ncbi:alpha-glucan family phosphorylase [Candidatus Woesebacteria bacterium]|nr:MAG: alpha-glucan family phosphorylase [Candidatus Woesebacteria bacterium]
MRLPEVKDPVVYFSNEFALDSELPTYVGGLGILAGDFINEAAFEHFPAIGVGILYKGKNYIQHITGDGKEEKRDSEFDHDTSFLRLTTINGKELIIKLPTPTGEISVKVYHLRLSDTTIVFFLSTDIDTNPDEWRHDMDTIYGGDNDSQIRQQILLGVGGTKLIKELGINPKVYHLNEGRAAFCIWELVILYMKDGAMKFDEAWQKAKENIVYTNHTLVDAGNPNYTIDTVKYWAKPYADQIGIDCGMLLRDGDFFNDFSITKYALNISRKQSAVSRVHGDYARKKYPDYNWVAITNGVFLRRWQDSDFRNDTITDEELWNIHRLKKHELMETVIKRTGFGYDDNKLVITWARRLADYKQPKAILKDIDRLIEIVSNSSHPVQILYAGNSHAADMGSKALIEEVIHIFSTKLSSHAIFIPNYNIALANHLTSGSDVWLNTPKGNLEACGTSGMKAISNGVLNCTVLDGWTYEVDWEGVGWTLNPESVADDFYSLLENEMAPCYYDRTNGLPLKWIKRMRKSIEIAEGFSAKRMLEEYKKYLYSQN